MKWSTAAKLVWGTVIVCFRLIQERREAKRWRKWEARWERRHGRLA